MIHTECPERPRLPVGKVLCVGRNWAAHAAEMAAPVPTAPIWFVVPATALALVGPGAGFHPWIHPPFSREVHHEVEMVVRLGDGGRDLSPAEAAGKVDAVAVGLDLTARDLQAAAKKAGLPWSVSKGFDGAKPLGPLVALDGAEGLGDRRLRLRKGDAWMQDDRSSRMLFPVAALLADASRYFRLEAGDLIYCGTPPGVGPLAAGDRLHAELEGCPPLRLEIRESPPTEARDEGPSTRS